ncbi:C40 family peptidase [Streptacidiphilus fuscans]|uniref:C40 family peptidase n=1 Tax=Streptacidiphilus fuscans TaxID=2789292 RepID=A0A931B888_9ACTN|nr:C40 family peptidase [Streptacidiphilus fuscans]MBF9072279.1 C40 family peptidase [Streptacidiphilus fuscans]
MPRSRPRRRKSVLFAVSALALSVVGTTAAAPPAIAAQPASASSRLAELQGEIATLYQQAESASARYDEATQAVTAQEAQIVAIARQIVAAQDKVDTLTSLVGQFAESQYSGLSAFSDPTLQALLAQDPGAYLAQIPLAQQASTSAAAALQQLQQAQATLAADGNAATTELAALTRSQAEAAAAVSEIKGKLAAAKALLASLSAADLTELQTMQAQTALAAQMAWRGTLTAAELGRRATGASRAAIAYAVAQIGKPYLWGGVGPSSFDCSGLTMRAWQAAGVDIPRTSETQWADLPHVPVSDLQPGDLIIYFHDASHVALYVGDGAIIEAPHPGGVVELAAAGSMPILGVVRPS